MRSGSFAMSSPESASAWRAAARTICAKRSMRRACLRSIHVGRVEVLQLAGEVDRELARVELLDLGRAGLARDQALATWSRRRCRAARPCRARSRPHAFCRSRFAIYIPSPPSTSSTSPVMNEASSEQRKRTAPATSSGSPSRPSGVFVEHRLRRLLGQDVGELRLHVAGRDDVRAHVAGAELARERLREADDPGLRGAVVRLAPVAVHADDRGDVDDRARRASSSSAASPRGRCRRRTRGSCRAPCASRRRTCGRAGRRGSGPALLTRMSRSPASSTSRARLARRRRRRPGPRGRRSPPRAPRPPPARSGSRRRRSRPPRRARPRSRGRSRARRR